jgi:hypothetical protein
MLSQLELHFTRWCLSRERVDYRRASRAGARESSSVSRRKVFLRKSGFYIVTIFLLLSLNALFYVLDAPASPANTDSPEAALKAPEQELLSGKIGKIAASGALSAISLATADEVTDRDILTEYGVKTLLERQYGPYQVQIFLADHPAQAYGVYSFYRDPLATATDFGTEGDLDVVDGIVRFWQGNRYVLVRDVGRKEGKAGGSPEQLIGLAQDISTRLSALDTKAAPAEDIEAAKQLPFVIGHLPSGSLRMRTDRYALGPRALSHLLGRDVSHYEFYPDFSTEVALASYDQGASQMQLVIFEYHTPQQAGSAFDRLSQFKDGLPAAEQAKLYIKRQGNFVVEATGFAEMATAERTVGAIKYDYVVKWLGDPPPARSFSSEAAKTAQILVSVFGIIGITLLIALITGIGCGTTIFYLRRRQERAIDRFSDAGGMVRLNLDGLALPDPQRDRKLLDGH